MCSPRPLNKKSVVTRIIGIDLGTSTSCVSILEKGEPIIITSVEGSRIIPTVVAFEDSGKILIGQSAERQAVLNPERTVFPLKRLLDMRSDSPHFHVFKNFCPNETTISDKGDVWIKINSIDYSPQHLLGIFLSKIREKVTASLGQDITKVVIGVPASFNEFQRQAIRDAAIMSGLEVVRIHDESTLAAIAHSMNYKGKDKTIALYDFGGGCFSISILEVGDGVVEVKSTSGNNYLGGDYFDFRIMEYLIAEFSIKTDNISLQRLKKAVKKAREELSVIKTTNIKLPNITLNSLRSKEIDMIFSREKLELLIKDFVELTIKTCQRANRIAGIAVEDIDEIVLMGSLSRMPLVKKMILEFFKKKPCLSLNLEESVAIGAAIIGGALTGDIKDLLLLDVTPFPLGIENPKGKYYPFIPKATTFPTKKTEVFSRIALKHLTDKIGIFQGEREKINQNILLEEIDFSEIIEFNEKEYELEISFEIEPNNVLLVNAKNLETGNNQSSLVVARRGLAEGDFQRINKSGFSND